MYAKTKWKAVENKNIKLYNKIGLLALIFAGLGFHLLIFFNFFAFGNHFL